MDLTVLLCSVSPSSQSNTLRVFVGSCQTQSSFPLASCELPSVGSHTDDWTGRGAVLQRSACESRSEVAVCLSAEACWLSTRMFCVTFSFHSLSVPPHLCGAELSTVKSLESELVVLLQSATC